ncbi:MAG: YfiR family protein [bacterium]
MAWTQTAGPTEYEIKAACLYNFAKLIDWPEDAFGSDDEPFCIGILGRDPFGQALERAVKDKTMKGRQIALRRSSGHLSCQLLFVCATESDNIERVLESTRGLPIVTVSELEGFADQGGTIEFYIEDNSVRFAINIDVANDARLEIDPQLLGLARVVTVDSTDQSETSPTE